MMLVKLLLMMIRVPLWPWMPALPALSLHDVKVDCLPPVSGTLAEAKPKNKYNDK